MYCTTCGAVVPQGQLRCEFCGTRVHAAAAPPMPPYGRPGAMPPMQHAPAMAGYGPLGEPLGVCPRCSFHGVGAGYFSRGENIAKLAAVTVLLGPPGPLAGGAYYYFRRNHRVCPHCGLKWGLFGQYAGMLPPPAQTRGAMVPHGGFSAAPVLPDEGAGRRWSYASIAFYLFAAVMMMVAIGEGEVAAAIFGMLSGGAGFGLQKRRDRRRAIRREMLQAQLEQSMLRLAQQHGGRLTVTEVASAMSWPMLRAEKVLSSLDDGFRVSSEVTDEGVIVYEFREIAHAPERMAAGGPERLRLRAHAPELRAPEA